MDVKSAFLNRYLRRNLC